MTKDSKEPIEDQKISVIRNGKLRKAYLQYQLTEDERPEPTRWQRFIGFFKPERDNT